MKSLSITARIMALICLIQIVNIHGTYASTETFAEPSFCSPNAFLELERGNNIPYLERARIFQVGKLTLAGLGVGNSDPRYVQSLVQQYADPSSDEKSCVFYMNNGNEEAMQLFNHVYAPSPVLRGRSIAAKYDALMTPLIDSTSTSFLSCARNHKFIALGCDGMKHRGPSVFAMLLAYAGCKPKSASDIANKIWGTNHVPKSTREAIAQQGYEAGNKNPAGRRELQKLMLGR